LSTAVQPQPDDVRPQQPRFTHIKRRLGGKRLLLRLAAA
jgi:hypothetical protein